MITTNSRLPSVPQMRQGEDTLLADGQAYRLTEQKGEAREIKQPTTCVVTGGRFQRAVHRPNPSERSEAMNLLHLFRLENTFRTPSQINTNAKQGNTDRCVSMKPVRGGSNIVTDSRGRKYQRRSDGWRRVK